MDAVLFECGTKSLLYVIGFADVLGVRRGAEFVGDFARKADSDGTLVLALSRPIEPGDYGHYGLTLVYCISDQPIARRAKELGADAMYSAEQPT